MDDFKSTYLTIFIKTPYLKMGPYQHENQMWGKSWAWMWILGMSNSIDHIQCQNKPPFLVMIDNKYVWHR